MCLYKKEHFLFQDKHRRKYIVIGNIKHWIPDSETRNAMGFRLNDFVPLLDEEIKKFQSGQAVDSIKRVKLIRDIKNQRDVYALFQSPCIEKRHIPNQKTRIAIGRRNSEIEPLMSEEFNKYPVGSKIDSYENWDDVKEKKLFIEKPSETEKSTSQINITGNIIGGDFSLDQSKNKRPIYNAKGIFKDIPLSLKYIVAFATIIAIIPIITTVINYFRLNYFNKIGIEGDPHQTISRDLDNTNNISTTTINVADLFSKALTLGTLVERQDFLSKYIDEQIYGEGVVEQISRWGDAYLLLDIKVNNITTSCRQDSNEENEKNLLLLKDKTIYFTGKFQNIKIMDHGMEIKDCKIY